MENQPKLLNSSNGKFWGTCIWHSLLHNALYKTGLDLSFQRKIMAFKQKQKYFDLFLPIILSAQKELQCQSIAVIPASTSLTKNSLQMLLNNEVFTRTKITIPQKNKKAKDKKNVDISDIIFNPSNLTGRILLIDDVITTGNTMRAFASFLINFDVVFFGLAINYKLTTSINSQPKKEFIQSTMLINKWEDIPNVFW